MFLLDNYHSLSPHLFHIFLNSHLLYEIIVVVEAERVQSRSRVDHEEPTGAGEKLLDLLVFWHVLNGRVDLLSDCFYGTLPFYVTMTSIQQPVCKHTTRLNLNAKMWKYLMNLSQWQLNMVLKSRSAFHFFMFSSNEAQVSFSSRLDQYFSKESC